jgi:ribosomal protein L11 methyltransferase
MKSIAAGYEFDQRGRLIVRFGGEISDGEAFERVRILKEYFRGLKRRDGSLDLFIDAECSEQGNARACDFRVEAFGAFGSGLHETTAGCIELISRFSGQRRNPGEVRVLDIGTGTGILALRAYSLGMRDITAVDVSVRAVISAFHNFHLNNIAEQVTLRLCSVHGVEGHYGLVLANILLPTILELFDRIVDVTVPGGVMILSGIKITEEPIVGEKISRYPDLQVLDILRRDGWICISLMKRKQDSGR